MSVNTVERARLNTELAKLTREVIGIGDRINKIAAQLENEVSDDTKLLREAAAEGQVLSFDYIGERDVVASRRLVSVYETSVDRFGEVESFLGFDHNRAGIRRFRVDRTQSTFALEAQVGFRAPA